MCARGIELICSGHAPPNHTSLALADDESGWCTFEQEAAHLSKGGSVYDLTHGHKIQKAGKLKSPEEMRVWFESEDVHFYGDADRKEVAKLYEDMLSRVGHLDKARKAERTVNRMMTRLPTVRWRISWIGLRLLIIVCLLAIYRVGNSPGALLYAAIGSFVLLLVMLIVVKLFEAPICMYGCLAKTPFVTRRSAGQHLANDAPGFATLPSSIGIAIH